MAKGVYWVGADGNIYMRTEGMAQAERWYAPLKSPQQMGLTEIDDPLNPSRPSSGGSSGGSGGASAPKLNQAAVDATQKAIGSLDVELDSRNASIDEGYDSLISKYNKEKARNETDYNDQTVTNNTNLSKNKQNALLAGAQGRRGLRSTLASIGALSGDGSILADRAVTTAANQDIGEATDSYAGNAQMLDKSWKNFQDEDKDRREEAGVTRRNQRTQAEGEVLSKRQQMMQKLAEIFGQADDTAEADKWLGRAGELNDDIARKMRVRAAEFSPRAAAFTPAELESYLAGAGDMTVDVSGGGLGGGPSTILAGRGRRKREEELAAA